MIVLARCEEPPALAAKRPGRLAAVRLALAAGEPRLPLGGYGDDGVKDRLFEGQHRKCAYCEKREEQAAYRDVEHFRPKSVYWWLAWTWENLLFACMDCNRGHKRDRFPLVDERARLVAETAPPGAERPLLLDPYDPALEPAHEIAFRREVVQRRERWRPVGLTDRGRETIAVCGLDRPALLTLYAEHVQSFVRVKLERFRAAEAEDAAAIVGAWSTLRRGVFARGAQFHALSHGALEALVSPELRARYQLALPTLAAARVTP